MTYKQILYLNTIGLYGSLTKAAKALNITTSALTHAMRQLEDETGLPLFSSNYRYVEMTHAGEKILEHCSTIVNDFSLLNSEIEALKRGKNQTIQFAFFIDDSLPLRINDYNAQSRSIHVNALQHESAFISESVVLKNTDIGIIASCDIAPDQYSLPYKDIELGLLMSPDHPLAGCRLLSCEMLNGLSISVPGFDSSLELSLSDYCAENGIMANIQKYPCGVFGKIPAIFHNDSACLYPYTGEQLLPNFSFCRVDPPILLSESVVWHKDFRRNKEIDSFLEYIMS